MSLTGHALLVLMVALTVLTVLGTVWVWPVLAVRSWPAVFLRLGTLLLTQLVLLGTLGLLVNDYFAFYSSWSDLLGRDRAQGVVQTGPPGAPAPRSPRIQLLGTTDVTAAGALGHGPDRIGRLDRVRIPGTTTGLSTDGYVYLPPQYFQPAFRAVRFPAAVVMTGFPGDARNLVTKLRYPSIELSLLRDAAVRPTVLLLMRPSPAMPRDTECEDVPGGPRAQTYFATDVPADLRASYRVLSAPGGLGVMGDSTGGYCAVKLGMEHPGVFSAAVSLSGYFTAAHDVTTGDLFGGSAQRRLRADLTWRLAHLPPPPVAVLLADSMQDGHAYRDSLAFAAAARPPMTVARATVATGGHNFTTWVRLLPPAFRWLSGHLAPPS